jgi:hypothetical protein
MKGLSVAQPWATLLVRGAKRLETRQWATVHRGPIVIHASKYLPLAARALCGREPFRTLLDQAGCARWTDLPRGHLIGVAVLVGCTRVEELPDIGSPERDLGDFGPGRWAWILADARPLPAPIPWKGRLGLFDVPDAVLQAAAGLPPPPAA